ncbi:hypothetical protein QFZ77_004803 [Paenibacillus sp. V4I3]|uniref:hypothetical protein n=1 Tax=Paenibacillus sp. V4I3 TaxID=3042305 RepID=UPI0027890A07|nr:hypothetical protein [Paenibacillus sp. V4I3]MDQ0876144.1 hypothetical protein [Paenibacillus sp. V4I3]
MKIRIRLDCDAKSGIDGKYEEEDERCESSHCLDVSKGEKQPNEIRLKKPRGPATLLNFGYVKENDPRIIPWIIYYYQGSLLEPRERDVRTFSLTINNDYVCAAEQEKKPAA